MTDEVLVKVEKVSKKFCRTLKRSLWYGVQDVAGELFGRQGEREQLRPGEFWSVKDVSFELKRGECLGLIGPNGAGKSTLLKMLNGLIKPDRGRITMHGRVGALIELGAGFNPILSGRENIYVNGSVLGFTKKEIDRKLDDIIEFSEIEEFIDTPVQNYSSGMRVRLGFAVAAQMEPDILLLDEVLAVGDVGFRSKCYNAIYDLSKNATIIFVTHNMQQLARLCSQAILLKQGRIIANEQQVAKVVTSYLKLFNKEGKCIIEPGSSKIKKIDVSGPLKDGCHVLKVYDYIKVSLEAFVESGHSNLEVNVTVLSTGEELIAQCNSVHNGFTIKHRGGNIRFVVTIPGLELNPGYYTLSLSIVDRDTNNILAWHHAAVPIKVEGTFYGGAPVQFMGEWRAVYSDGSQFVEGCWRE